ncbi:MAG: glycosyltransferase family 2 protein, partial [Deltaproteobacteria bacterium]|nr:glycosyltransferase family 2 protein [Deltaproteobacteria bacterium]
EKVVGSWLGVLDRSGISGEVVVTDDGSTDRTRSILQKMAAADPRVRLVVAPENGGYGRALRQAIAAARGDFVVTIDSDGQFDPEDIPRLLECQRRGDFDLVTGFRSKKHDTPLRVAADLGLRSFVRQLFGLRLRDPNCALKLMRREWVQGAKLEAEGYPTPTEIMVRAHHEGLQVAEVGVSHLSRAGGASKLGLVRTALDASQFLIRLRLRL